MRRFKFAIIILFSGLTLVHAVQLSTKGAGEVLIFPYYSVNNELNTLYSIVNTTADSKALKINFYEGHNGTNVMSFNVYLSAYDVWTGALVATISEHEAHLGEKSTQHFSTDYSCAPLLEWGEEFSTNGIENDQNTDLIRVRSGFFVVIEMGVLSGFAEEYAEHGNDGLPENCDGLEEAWYDVDENWSLNTTILPPSGGLIGSAFLVDVNDGISFSFDALALQNFWGEEIFHYHPKNNFPDLNYSEKSSSILLPSGELAISDWEHGFQAVSAVFMQSEIWNEYALESFLNSKTEWVITMPTKHFHTNLNQAETEPFSSQWNGSTSCDLFEIDFYDREQQFEAFSGGTITQPPQPPGPNMCSASNVLRILMPESDDTASMILGGDSVNTFRSPSIYHATESGWAKIKFDKNVLNEHYYLTPLSGQALKGLPVTGFAVQKFYNLGAQPGLLAQYGSLFMHKGKVETLD